MTVSIDEATAVVISGTHAEVIGSSYAAFYVSDEWKTGRGPTAWMGRDFILLKAGNTFDLAAREPILWDSGGQSAKAWEGKSTHAIHRCISTWVCSDRSTRGYSCAGASGDGGTPRGGWNDRRMQCLKCP